MSEKFNIDAVNSILSKTTMLNSFSIQVNQASGLYDLVLVLSNHELDEDKQTIHFSNISDLKTDFDAAGWIQLMMLRVSKKSDGFERKYLIQDLEHQVINFRCEDVLPLA